VTTANGRIKPCANLFTVSSLSTESIERSTHDKDERRSKKMDREREREREGRDREREREDE
jgi:hypothetical protein